MDGCRMQDFCHPMYSSSMSGNGLMEVFVQSLVQYSVERISKFVLARSMMVVGNLINVGQKCPWDLEARNAMNTVQLIVKMKKSW